MSKHPHIIVVLSDEHRGQAMGHMGDANLRTPNMDRLHDEGVRFTDFHVSPTCSPTRSALMTGRHEFKNGVTHTILERERLTLCSINLSGQSLGDEKFLPYVIEQFQMSGLDATKICFEITETAAIASFAQASRFINALKELGCKFALDDFGTGLSSFGYLKHFPVDFLKIDGSFVKGLLHDPIDREMVRSINEIGHLTGKQTIAEWAENAEIIEILRGLGVDYAQGYGVSQPQKVQRAAIA